MIPFNRPTIAPRQIEYVTNAFRSHHLAGDGLFTRMAAEQLSSIHGGAKVLLTTSCTAALELSAILLDLQVGDEVIVPSFTFVSSANAFALMGAKIVFVDVDPVDLNLDIEQVVGVISPRTRAIVAVNYGGQPSVTPALLHLASQHGVTVIEDNAHGLFATSAGQPVGIQSSLSTLSFHETKNVTCGEGGALVINDPELVEQAEIIREKGTNRSNFFRGVVDKYTWIGLGSSYLLSDVNAAILAAQLEFSETIQARRRDARTAYLDSISDWAFTNQITLPPIDSSEVGPSHLFFLLLPDLETRTRFLSFTRERGVATTFHYIPLDSSPAGRRFGVSPLGCPVTQSASDRLVRLPMFSDISEAEVSKIIETVTEFAC
jgi:dTDP-4-amino-4,6-dideoxygalactose transaminase